MSLSCLYHVKRSADSESGAVVRPPAPAHYTFLELCVDRSGSMSSFHDIPMKGSRDFMAKHQSLAKKTGTKTFFSFTSFDDVAKVWFDNVDITTMTIPFGTQLSDMLRPRGCTLLIDTMYERMVVMRRHIKELVKGMPRAVRNLKPKICGIFCLITDGDDNRSRLYKPTELNALVGKCRAEGISIVYVGANQDAIRIAANFGIPKQCAMTFGNTPATAAAAFRSATQATFDSAHHNSAPQFTPLQRQQSAPAACHAPSSPTAAPVGYPYPAFPQLANVALPQFNPFGAPNSPPSPLYGVPPMPVMTRQTTISAYNFR